MAKAVTDQGLSIEEYATILKRGAAGSCRARQAPSADEIRFAGLARFGRRKGLPRAESAVQSFSVRMRAATLSVPVVLRHAAIRAPHLMFRTSWHSCGSLAGLRRLASLKMLTIRNVEARGRSARPATTKRRTRSRNFRPGAPAARLTPDVCCPAPPAPRRRRAGRRRRRRRRASPIPDRSPRRRKTRDHGAAGRGPGGCRRGPGRHRP